MSITDPSSTALVRSPAQKYYAHVDQGGTEKQDRIQVLIPGSKILRKRANDPICHRPRDLSLKATSTKAQLRQYFATSPQSESRNRRLSGVSDLLKDRGTSQNSDRPHPPRQCQTKSCPDTQAFLLNVSCHVTMKRSGAQLTIDKPWQKGEGTIQPKGDNGRLSHEFPKAARLSAKKRRGY